ncbi:MAG: orotidine-5'-phosphate decarboxylase [Pseudomonadota bacterium]|nr:orotidine-5'-phosphate decarboxylase [Pseudomonadota bacterium]
MASTHFATRLANAIRSSGTPLCMGIDPHPAMMPPLFGDVSEAGHPRTIRAISDFTMACLEAARGRVAAIKPQAAFFEAQGPDGMRVLAALGRAAVDSGMLVIMDAKRNDIGSTNAAYAQAWIGHEAPFPSDALTVNTYLGLDTLEPLLARADAVGAGLFVLTRTSNPGAGALQDLDVGGKPLFHNLAEQLAPLATARCDAAGRSALGIVAGATWPDEARALRAILPSAPFLVPGFGAQGAGPADALAGLTRDGDGWQNGLINSTRGLIFPKSAADAGDIASWRDAIDQAISDSRAALASV